jgi:hypothetical protein
VVQILMMSMMRIEQIFLSVTYFAGLGIACRP